jgi:hypothetical protein
MKKTLLLSVVASTMIMAGGDIAPVEPVVVEEVSAWEFSGDMVAYTQTRDNFTATGNTPNSIYGNNTNLFGGSSTSGILGLSLRAVNKDVFAGIGFGGEVTATANGYNNGYSDGEQVQWGPLLGFYNQPAGSRGNFGLQHGNALTQAYLTYGIDAISTSLKVGRQHLPKSLSPFAFTEGWQAVKNSFDAALVVNSSLPDTTAVYAFVKKSNRSVGDLNNFNNINPSDDGVHMLTLQNKSIDNLTLTGSWYYAPNMISAMGIPTPIVGYPFTLNGDVNVLWGDIAYNIDDYGIGLAVQGGQVSPDKLSNTSAWGAKITGNLSMFNLLAAYSHVGDGAVPIHNLGTGVKTPLYTQSIADQNTIKIDANAFKLAAGMKALGGKFGLAYIYSDLKDGALPSTFTVGGARGGSGSYTEVDFTYKTKVTEDMTLFAGYVYQQDKRDVLVNPITFTPIAFSKKSENQNFVRFWARYNFN